eukprot:g192.t1
MSLHIAKRLIRDGHYVAVSDARIDALRETFEDILTPSSRSRVLVLHLDVTDATAWDDAMEAIKKKWGGLDVCFNIAGVLCPNRIQHATTREIELQIDVNVKGVSLGTRAAARIMLESQKDDDDAAVGGHIVNFSSMGGVATVAGVTLYAASKYAVRGLSLASSKDLAGTGVDVTCFMPDAVQTPMVDLQLRHDDASMAFSGDILSLAQVEACIFDHVLPYRLVEVWLSSRARVARFGDIFGNSRLVAFVERAMKRSGRKRQDQIKRDMASNGECRERVTRRGGGGGGLSKLPDQTSKSSTFSSAAAAATMPSVLWTLARIVAISYLLLRFAAVVFLLAKGPEAAERLTMRLETAEEIARLHADNIAGRTFVVTGASSGIGEATASALAVAGGRVIVATRSESRGLAAVARINSLAESSGGGSAHFELLDLASFESVDTFVDRLALLDEDDGECRPPVAIVLNAGIVTSSFSTTKDGVEANLQINHLAQQYLVTSLLDRCPPSAFGPPVRVVVVSSWAPSRASPRGPRETGGLVHYRSSDEYPFLIPGAYGMSKQCGVRFSRELDKRYGDRVSAYALHPGLVATNLGTVRSKGLRGLVERAGARMFWFLTSYFLRIKTVDEGAATSVHCVARASDAESGLYFDDARVSPWPRDEDNDPNVVSKRNEMDAACWMASERVISKARNGAFRLDNSSHSFTKSPRGEKSIGDSAEPETTTNTTTNAIFVVVAHLVAYYGLFTLAEVAISSGVFANGRARKINSRPSDLSIVRREKMRTLSSAVVDGIYHIFIASRVSLIPTAEASWTRLIGVAVLVLLWTDAHFYFTHRMLHAIPLLYEKVHAAHHESHNPNPWSSCCTFVIFANFALLSFTHIGYETPPSSSLPRQSPHAESLMLVYIPRLAHPPHRTAFHPVEAIIFFSAYLVVYVVDFPHVMWWAFKIGMVVGPLHAHVGYNLNKYGIPGPQHHYLHHRWKRGNFGGAPTGLWDKLFGTEIGVKGKRTGASANLRSVVTIALIIALAMELSEANWLGFADSFTTPLFVGLGTIVLLWILLLDGSLVVLPPVSSSPKKKKVFVCGLSRTGTTSMTAALNALGFETHHFCGPLVSLDRECVPHLRSEYAAGLDAHTDLAPALVVDQLVETYAGGDVDAYFVYTTRPRTEWAQAMLRFVGEEPRRSLFRWHPTPFRFYTATYGRNWDTYGEREWVDAYDRHDKRVREILERLKGGDRRRKNIHFMELSISTMGKEGRSDEIWRQLCAFLEVPLPSSENEGPLPAFPHRFVFQYSFWDQPLRQFGYMWKRLVASRWTLLALCVLIATARFFDLGQCDRSCRVMNPREGGGEKEGPMPFGSWFEPATVRGRRALSSPDKCVCWDVTGAVLERSEVDRIHPAIATEDQYWFLDETERVCASNGAEYDRVDLMPVTATVTNCGQCAFGCSAANDVDAMHRVSTQLTRRASVGGILFLLFGRFAHRAFFRTERLVGFGEACATCWYEATRCNLASCAHHCLFGWENPLSMSSTLGDSKRLNRCMECDELHCSAYYLQSCGANRRSAGVITDIDRPTGHICQAAREGARARRENSE